MSDNSSDLYDGIKSQYEQEFDAAKNIDNKASNMIATAGTVTGLLFGFGTFLVSNISITYEFLYYAIALLIIALASNITSVFLCVLAYRIRDYQYAVTHNSFFKEEGYSHDTKQKGGNFDEEEINKYKRASKDEIRDFLLHQYLSCNKLNHETNNGKAKKVMWSQIIFFISLLIFPILVGLVLHAYVINQINAKAK